MWVNDSQGCSTCTQSRPIFSQHEVANGGHPYSGKRFLYFTFLIARWNILTPLEVKKVI